MKLFKRIFLGVVLTTFLIPTIASSRAGTGDQAGKPATAQEAASTQPAASPYVGADTCKMCHEEIFNGLQKTRHWNSLLKTEGGAEAHSCETCHGPGAEHVNSGGDKTKIFMFKEQTPETIDKRCLACHTRREETAHFQQSVHADAGLSCISCHSPHFAKEPRRLLVASQPVLCYHCHSELTAEFNQPFRHRVNEGLIKCTDCHNPHGTFLNRSLRADSGQDTVCFKCHRNLQGPFAFEHVPVKTEGCQSCHQAHGSINPRLLKVNQVNILCLQCHTVITTPNTRSGAANAPGTPASPVHDQSAKFQACTMCHVQIHGSNADETFMK